jgi:hypothetical protein
MIEGSSNYDKELCLEVELTSEVEKCMNKFSKALKRAAEDLKGNFFTVAYDRNTMALYMQASKHYNLMDYVG